MGINVSTEAGVTPSVDLFREWFVLRCGPSSFRSNNIALSVLSLSICDGQYSVGDHYDIERLKEDIASKCVCRCYIIEYLTESWHVAAVLQHGTLLEYVDSMAVEPNKDNCFAHQQQYVEQFFEQACHEHGMEYRGSYEMYGKCEEDEFGYEDAYKITPPQACENQFLGELTTFLELSSEEKLRASDFEFYRNARNQYIANACEFWACHIVTKMIKHNISSSEWAMRLSDYCNRIMSDQPKVSSELSHRGKIIAEYVVRKLTKDLSRCWYRRIDQQR